MSNILEVKNLAKSFGQVKAVQDVTVDVREGELMGIIGPNGAGKTSVFNLLTGVYQQDTGSMIFAGTDMTSLPVHKRSVLGLGRTFQIPRPFGDMTVYENLLVASTFSSGMKKIEAKERLIEILQMTGLYEKRNDMARSLRLLDRKRLELARGLATNPRLLLMDEIAGGLTEGEAWGVFEIVKKIQERGVTIIWIEHIMAMMAAADRLLALAQGATIMCDAPDTVLNSKEVLECYLGSESNA
jgi:branched-chain amino acid transport system ATP-binding protein